MVKPNDVTIKHFYYPTNSGMKTLCGVCLRNECTEDLDKTTCLNCLRLINETNVIDQIKEEIE